MKQQRLFDAAPPLPAGFIYQQDFLSSAEEQAALAVIRTLTFGEVRMHGVVAKRRIVHFGLRYAFSSHHLSPAPEMPSDFDAIRARAAALANIAPSEFQEILVTEYPPGAGIGWHRDAPPFGIIAGVSFGSACKMRFRKENGGSSQSLSIELPPRSAYVLTGSVRSDWQHSIPPISETRYSITFRTLKSSPQASTE